MSVSSFKPRPLYLPESTDRLLNGDSTDGPDVLADHNRPRLDDSAGCVVNSWSGAGLRRWHLEGVGAAGGRGESAARGGTKHGEWCGALSRDVERLVRGGGLGQLSCGS